MNDIIPRPYAFADLADCLAIFDGNVPTFFSREERAEFLGHLENLDAVSAPYVVLVRDSVVVACGGLSIDETGKKASLSWGMVARGLHGQGMGTILIQARLTLARSIAGLAEVRLSTSQHTYGFYKKFGFDVSAITPSGFGPGLDRWDMTLRL